MRVLGSIVILLTLLLPLACSAKGEPFHPPRGGDTVGLAWDNYSNRWWVSDKNTNTVSYSTDAEKGWNTYISAGNLNLRVDEVFGPIAVAENTLWLVVEGEDTAHIVTIETSDDLPMVETGRIEIPPAGRRRSPSVSGLTWDGRYLWLITSCGLCSNLFQIDPNTGREIFSFFPASNARGIAFRKNGPMYEGELWIIAHNGPNKDHHLALREISGSRSTIDSTKEHFRFGGSRGSPEDPIALAVRGQQIWTLDRKTGFIDRYQTIDMP